MKKILLFASALAGLLLAASCQQENLEPEQMAGTVKFTVEAPGAIATKAGTINAGATIADGTNVNEVHYEVYKNVADVDHALLDPTSEPMAKGVVEMANKKANITLDLLQDQEYTVIFWAQVEGAGHYDTSDLRCVAFEGEVDANDESRAAFFKRFDFDTYEHKDYANIILRRPFAQLNLLTTMESLKPVSTGQTSGYEIDAKKSEIIVSGLANSFNTVEGVGVAYDQPLTFAMAATPEEQGQATLTVNGKDYHYVSMNYMFVPVDAEDGSATVELKYEIDTDKGSIKHEIVNVPIRENYRTNVIGNLFTKESKFEIIVDAEFDGQNLVDVWDGREVSEPAIVDGKYVISTAAELAWLSAAVNGTLPVVVTKATETPKAQTFKGKTFMLLEDINLDNPSIELPDVTWTPIGATGKFEGTFDGNGKTIYGLKVVTEGKASAGLFANCRGLIKNLTVEGAVITGHYKTGVIVGDGLCSRIENCHVENATVVVTPYDKDDANNVGGIVGYLSAEPTAYVKNCSVKNSNITAYRKVAGIVGAANRGAEVSGNTVENSTITADQTFEYSEVKPADLGAVAGYKHADVVETENTAKTGVTLVHKVNTIDELNNAADDANVVLAEGTYDLTNDLTVDKAIEITEGEVVIDSQDNTITAGSPADYGFRVIGAESSLVIDADVESLGGGIGVDAGAKVTFNSGSLNVNTTNTSGRYNFYVVGEGSEVTINGGEFSFDPKKNQKRAYIYCGAGATVYVKGGTFGKASTRSGYTAGILGDGKVIITGGTFGFDPTQWVPAGYIAEKDGDNWVVVSLAEGDNLKEAVSVPGATVKMAAGEYTFPSSSIAEGVTIECEEGTVFTGTSSLNIKGATVIGATFSNPSGTAASYHQTINGTFKDCIFTGSNAIRYAYAGETCYFENCEFSGSVYGFHFDGGTNDAYFKNCTFSGFNAFGSAVTLVTFDECTFKSNGKSGYNGANLWGSTKMINTKFIFDGTASTEWIDCISPDKTYEFTGCTLNGGSLFHNQGYLFSRNSGTKITIDGVTYTWKEGDYLVAENGTAVATDQSSLNAALNANETEVQLVAGEYVVPSAAKGKTVTFKGTENPADVKVAVTKVGTGGENCDYGLDGSTVTFENITITTNSSTYIGYARCNGTYKNCIINGTYTLYGNSVFEHCTFNVSGDVYNIWTWGAPTATFTECTFNSDGKALLLYGTENTKLTVNKCTFNDKGGLSDKKAAIEIGNDYNKSYELIVNNTTVNGYEINDKGINTNTTLWANKNSMPKEKLNVVVDGVDVY